MTREIAYSEPSLIYTGTANEKWNPDDLMGRKGFGIYKKMMLDEQIKAVVKFRTDSIISRSYMFDIDREALGDDESDRRIGLFEHIIDNIKGSWTDKVRGVLTATYNGFSMTEKVTHLIEFDKKQWVGVKDLKLRPFDSFTFKVDKFGNIKKIVQKAQSQEIKINPKRFIHYVVSPEFDEHYGKSELREAYRAWFSKDWAIKFRNMWLERHAGGFKYIQPVKGSKLTAGTAEYTAIQNILSNWNASTGAILPGGVTLETEYPSNQVAYKEAIEDYNFAIAMALLVPNLVGITPQAQTGSYAQSETQLYAFNETLLADINRLEETLNEQLFSGLGDLNWGDGIYPEYKIIGMSASQKLSMITMFNELVKGGSIRVFEDDEDHIRKSLGFPDKPEDAEETNPIGGLKEEDPKNEEEPEEKDDSKPEEKEEEEELSREETVLGKGSISVSAFSRAERRVDFAVIAKNSSSIVDEYVNLTADIMDLIVQDMIFKGKGGGDVGQDVSKNVAKVKADGKLKQKLNRAYNAMLKEGVSTGTKQAAMEVEKSKREFSADYMRLDFIADDFFRTQAFKITGNLTDSAQKIIEEEIMNGSRFGKSWEDIENTIYERLATEGMISIELAKQQLGEALGTSNPDARLRTIARTSTFDAINNARYSYFTDPALGDFVQAFEYSAILDGRTTQICKHLDDESRGNHSKDWWDENQSYKPPNHFNCRSILVPVTRHDLDDYEEGEEPTLRPQKGFR